MYNSTYTIILKKFQRLHVFLCFTFFKHFLDCSTKWIYISERKANTKINKFV